MQNCLSVTVSDAYFSQSFIPHLLCVGQGMEDHTENIPDFQGNSNAKGSYLCSVQIKEKDTSYGVGKTSWVGWEMSLFTLQSAGTWGIGKGRR